MENQTSNSEDITTGNQNNPVGWFEIYVDDLQRAQQFYEAVFKVTMQNLADPTEGGGIQMIAFTMDPGGPNASGALVKINGFKAGGNSTIVYFSAEDCAVEEARVEQAGGKIFQKKMSIGEYGFASLCTDTEGNMFGIHSMQ